MEERQFVPVPRTSMESPKVGQPDHDTDSKWEHFHDKYGKYSCFVAETAAFNRPDLAEDAYQTVLADVRKKGGFGWNAGEGPFHRALMRRIKFALCDLIRREKSEQYKRYCELTAPLNSKTNLSSGLSDRTALDRIVLKNARILLSDNYKDHPIFERFDPRQLMIWRHRYQPGATGASTAAVMKLTVGQVDWAQRQVNAVILQISREELEEEQCQ